MITIVKVKLTATQKDEVRRLTQLANRRIKATEKVYRKEGKDILPAEMVGHLQHKSKWHTAATPLSRSVVFEDERAYRQHLRFLRSFEREKENITAFQSKQAEKLILALETSLGADMDEKTTAMIGKLTPPQLSNFWERFSRNAARMGVNYSSDAAMSQTLSEFYYEDIENLKKGG